jgi:hypothetical protein
MIQIRTTPPETFFAGNPVIFKVNSDNQFSTVGRKCSFYLNVSQAETEAGRTLIFAFPSKTIVFTTAATPNDSGLQIPTALLGGNWATWAQSLYDCFMSNFDISSRFAIVIHPAFGSYRYIEFISYDQGTAFTPTITTTLRTVVVYSFVAGIDPVSHSLFSIIGGLWDSNFRQIAQDSKPVNGLGDVTFNFSEYLSALLDADTTPRFTWPFNPAQIIRAFSNYDLVFYAGFAERYDGAIRKLLFDTQRTAFGGGLNRETLVAYTASGDDFFGVPENVLSFMTWAPVMKITSKTTPELLFFYTTSKPPFASFLLCVGVYFTDNTSDSFTEFFEYFTANDVLEFSVGYQQLELAGRFPTKTVAYWTIKLANEESHTDTETRTFVLDNKVYENERVFIFQNSYGKAYDVVRFTGQGSSDIDVDFTTSNSDTIGDYTAFNAPVNKFTASELQKLNCNSGWITAETKDYLRDLLLSKQVFEYKDKSLFPIIITNDKMKSFFSDNEYLYDLEIRYDRAYRDFFFQGS